MTDVQHRARLHFAGDGRAVVVAETRGLRVIEVDGGVSATLLPTLEVSDFAVFRDEVWVVSEMPHALHRVSLSGQALGGPVALPADGHGPLVRSPSGEATAIWMGPVPLRLYLERGELVVSPLPDCDLAVPISARRWVVARGGQLTMGEPGGDAWCSGFPSDTLRAIDALAIFDGRALAVLAQNPDGEEQQLLVLNTRDGGMTHRIALQGVTGVRFAAHRGCALLRLGPHKLLALDLRFGRALEEVAEPQDVVDFAIDDSGQHLALQLRDDDGRVATVYAPYRDFMTLPGPGTAIPQSGNGEPAPALHLRRLAPLMLRRPSAQPPAGPGHEAPLVVPALPGLAPRPMGAGCSQEESIGLLERHLRLVGAWCGRAIALSWDSGRLVRPEEGKYPFETEVFGILGRVAGQATSRLREAEQAVTEAAAGLRAAEQALAGRLTPLRRLAQEFQLSEIACEILLVVAAPAFWGELSRLYGILANDADRELCDELLVCQIIGGRVSRHSVARALERSQPLHRYGLVRSSEGRIRSFVSLSVDPLVIKLLRDDAMEADPREPVTARDADRRLDQLVMPQQAYRGALERLAHGGDFARIAVRGRLGSGRHTLLAALAGAAHRRLGVIDASHLAREPKARLEELRTLLQRVQLRGWLPCVDGLDDVAADDQAMRDQLREIFRTHPGPLALRLHWDAAPPLDPGHILIDLPPLSDAERLAAWPRGLAEHGLSVTNLDTIASRYRTAPGVMQRAASGVVRAPGDAASADAADRDASAQLEASLKQHIETRLGTTATRVTRLATWTDAVLPSDVLDSLLELIARIKHRKTVYDAWGFDRTMTSSRGLTALFQGGPGTGKSMVAGIIASELGLDLYRVDLSRIMSKWIGETERNLAAVFDAAEDAQAIVLFDEADSLFAKRTEVKSSVDRYANLEVNYLLQRLGSFDGIVILTTNFGGSIDPAFKRRLSLRLTFPFPDEEMREQLWRVHLPPELPTSGDFDFMRLARKYQLSGGYIRNSALRAAFLAAEEHSPLTQDHLERAIRAEFREIGKLAQTGVLE